MSPNFFVPINICFKHVLKQKSFPPEMCFLLKPLNLSALGLKNFKTRASWASIADICNALNYWSKDNRWIVIRGIKLSSNKTPSSFLSTRSLYYYQVAQSLYRDKWITISHLWWISQWLVNHGHRLAVIIRLHVSQPFQVSFRSAIFLSCYRTFRSI